MYIVIGIVLMIGGGVVIYLTAQAKKRLDLIVSTPTSKAASVKSAGFYEVKGVIEADGALDMPGTGKRCVYYHVKVEERVRESYYSGGRHQTRDSWRTVQDQQQEVPFQVRDESGTIQVFPSGAEVEAPCAMSDRETAGLLEGMFAMRGAVTGSRVTVHALEPGTEVYVLGPVSRSASSLAFQRGDQPFLISHRSEEELVQSKQTWSTVGTIAAPLLILAGGTMVILGLAGR